jgi:hypothetical protein
MAIVFHGADKTFGDAEEGAEIGVFTCAGQVMVGVEKLESEYVTGRVFGLMGIQFESRLLCIYVPGYQSSLDS